MRRFLAAALIVAASSTTGLVGCADKSEVTTTEKVSTPEGTTTTKDTKEIKSTGENPPPNSAGQTGDLPK